MKPVLVSWADAVSDDPWTNLDKAKELEPPIIKTLGWLIYEDDKKIVLAASLDESNDNCASVYAIPRTWLLDIKELAV